MANIRVVVVAPDKIVPEVRVIANELKPLQEIVGGYIECVQYHGLDLYCNEEGKINGLPVNRPLYDGDEMYEIISGQFLLSANDNQGNNRDLTDAEIAKAIDLFTWTKEKYDKWISNLRALGVQVSEG